MRRGIGVLTLGPLIWLLARWLSRQPPEWWRAQIEALSPRRLRGTRPGGDDEVVPAPPEKPAPYEPPDPDDPESGDTTLSPEGSPGAHRVVPN